MHLVVPVVALSAEPSSLLNRLHHHRLQLCPGSLLHLTRGSRSDGTCEGHCSEDFGACFTNQAT